MASKVKSRVAAGSMIFDSWDIAASVIAHFVSQGVTDFYLADHRSTGNPRDEFLSTIPENAVIHWVRKESPRFTQMVTLTALANLARKDGFEAFIAFDADEFFVGSERPLVDEIVDWLDNESTMSLRCEMINFYQSHEVQTFTPGALSSVRYSANKGLAPNESRQERNPQFRRFPFYYRRSKAIMRLVPGSEGDCDWINFGNHHVMNISTKERYPATRSATIKVLHLPYRSREGITARKGNKLRKKPAGIFTFDTGSAEFSMTDSEREKEWQLASIPAGTILPEMKVGEATAVLDARISNLEPKITSLLRSPKSPKAAWIDESTRIADVSQDLAMSLVVFAGLTQSRFLDGSNSDNSKPQSPVDYQKLERKIIKLQSRIDNLRPNLLRLVLNRLRRR
ncbi:MAG: glycosyltransferase family 2 protein [Microbacteriaceae bacterium]|nr:glycosyltransferase family 2 protein [Microbacteriaceae bacterium]